MPVELETSEGPLVVSDQEIQAVARFAARQADLTAAVLDATGLFPEKPARLPAAFLLELAAVLELAMWERQGLRNALATDLPTYHEAAAQLAARAEKGPEAFAGPDAAPLSQKVRHVWIDSFAWEGQELLGCEAVIGTVDEDEFAKALADFIWQHRRKLSGLLKKTTMNDRKTI